MNGEDTGRQIAAFTEAYTGVEDAIVHHIEPIETPDQRDDVDESHGPIQPQQPLRPLALFLLLHRTAVRTADVG